MASTPTSLFNSDYIFSPEFCEIPTTEPPDFIEIPQNFVLEEKLEATFLWNNQEIFPYFENGSSNISNSNNTTSMLSSNDHSTALSSFFGDVSSFPQPLGVMPRVDVDVMEPTTFLPDYDIGCYNSTTAGLVHQYQRMPMESLQFQQPVACYNDEFNKKYCEGFGSDFQAVSYGDPNSNVWEIQGNSLQSSMEEQAGSAKIRRYSEEERKNRILKYLKKRNQRNFNKTIKYACRKTLADRRIRIRGRFARNNEVGEESTTTKKTDNNQEEDEYNTDGSQTKNNEEEWLQEAITNLMYLPIFA